MEVKEQHQDKITNGSTVLENVGERLHALHGSHLLKIWKKSVYKINTTCKSWQYKHMTQYTSFYKNDKFIMKAILQVFIGGDYKEYYLLGCTAV
jgi:hypothetical protein